MAKGKTSGGPGRRGNSRHSGNGSRDFPVVGIGASAGGLEAALDLLRQLPHGTGMAFVLVQHLDPNHESMLPALLQKATPMPSIQVKHGMKVEQEHLYIIPPNTSMSIEGRVLKLTPRGGERRYMPIDHFLCSLAVDAKSKAIGIILSGTASDGVIGMESIKAEGGITFAQDEASAKYPEMPRNAAAAGCVDLVLTPKAMAQELARIGKHPYVAETREKKTSASETSKDYPRIFALLRKMTEVDFSFYKQATIQRRIARRMALHKMQTLGEYIEYLQHTPKEVEALYQDLLIKVTGFFREPDSFKALKNKILPAIDENRLRNAPIRIWVPGCSTGEEAYSIAMSLVEYMQGAHVTIPCQIFATDLSEMAVERARAGIYRQEITADVPPDRLRRFFSRLNGGYQIAKMIRDMCVIARQDLVKDPPFSKLDLISCRNVLIYLEPVLQRKIFPLFHYALKPGGYLMLGTSESVGDFSNLFNLVDRKCKIYSRKQVPATFHFDAPLPEVSPSPEAEPSPPPARDVDVGREVDRLILGKYAPAGVVVNNDFEILQFRGRTDRYLQSAPGKASLNLLKMAREGLLSEMRTALQKARKENVPVRTQPVQVADHDKAWSVRIEAIPLTSADRHDRQFLVLFDENVSVPAAESAAGREKGAGHASQAERRLEQMKQELAGTREHLQSIIEEQETTNEELKSANEEILSSNEELQSTNEELETAKEELQSTNEELTTLNEELQTRNLEVNQVNNDMTNLLASVSIPIIMLGPDLRIRRFTPLTEKVFNLIATDIGRPITDIKSNIEVPDLERMILRTIESVSPQELEVRDRDGRWYLVRVRPYRTRENQIDGAVMLFMDIDEHKRSSAELGKAHDYAEALFDMSGDAVLLLDAELRIRKANRAFHRIFQVSQQETDGKRLFEFEGGQWDVPELRSKLEGLASGDGSVRELEVTFEIPRLSPSSRGRYRISALKVLMEDISELRILLGITEA